jgi:glucose-6-phosphate 1-epimerase
MSTAISLPTGLRLEPGQGGLERLVMATSQAHAEIYLHGAHLTMWRPSVPDGGDKSVLWLSERSNFVAGRPIRGGVPICFPWFGQKAVAEGATAPMHGFARNLGWKLSAATCSPAGEAHVEMRLASRGATREWWPHDFEALFQVGIGRSLAMALIVRNTGNDDFTIEEALHTYFTVGDVRKIRITGLERVGYFDKTHDREAAAPSGAAITFTEETDRLYAGTEGNVVLHDPVLGRRITVAKSGSKTTVVWNPWIAKAKAMPDFGDDEWPGMVCIESANVAPHAVKLQPGQTHRLGTVLSVEKE